MWKSKIIMLTQTIDMVLPVFHVLYISRYTINNTKGSIIYDNIM